MRILAVIFSAIGIYELLQLVNVEIYHLMPAQANSAEGGTIVAAKALLFGSAAAMIGLLIAFGHFRQAQNERGRQLLLAWCSLVPVAFVGLFIYAYAHSK